jgi:hypothetical protein
LGPGDFNAAIASLADDVVIRLAVHDRPIKGKTLARVLIQVFMDDVSDVQVQQEIVEESTGVVVYDGIIDDRSIEVLNLLEHDSSGSVSELRIFLRPLGAVAVAAEVVMTHMADRMDSPGPRAAMRAGQAVQKIKGKPRQAGSP